MSGNKISVRQTGRRIALQALFEMEWMESRDVDASLDTLLELLEKDDLLYGDDAISFARSLISGVERHRGTIDEIISRHAKNWRFERMNAIDRNIMRIAVFEIHFNIEVPGKVAINEAIEMAKEFGGDDAPIFINGVLDSILKMNADHEVRFQKN